MLAPIGVSFALLWFLWDRARHGTRFAELATALTLPWVFLVFAAWGTGAPTIPPRAGSEWLLPLAAAGAVLSCAAGVLGQDRRDAWRWVAAGAWWAVRSALIVGALLLMARNVLEFWPREDAVLRIGGWTLAGLAAWWGIDRAARVPGAIPPNLLVIVCAGMSISIALTAVLKPAVLAAGVCATIGPALLVAIRMPYLRLAAAAGFVPAFLAGLWFTSHAFNEMPAVSNACSAVACVGAGLTTLRPFARLRGRVRWTVHLALVGVPALGGIAWIIGTQPLPV
ncbi:MAG: hypothetical protein SFY69_02320 [Planctomycetota bacterium]|nr:hypothetical protein [Planctomycetota bacterium]